MRSSFFEFNVAISGLFTARANLEVTSHNIANAAIKGYSRQYAMQRATAPLALFTGKGMVGTGSEVYGIGQIRDFYLDKKYWSERGVLGEYTAKKSQLSLMESIFNELGDSSLTTTFNDFFGKLQSLSESSGDYTYRTNVIQSAANLCSMMNLTAESLKRQQTDVNTEIKATVQIMNSLGQQISSLNRQIATYEMDGSTANDLRDQRARLIDELSLYVNVDVRETEMNKDYAAGLYPEPEDAGKSDKRFSIMINGYEFVNHFDVFPLEVRERPAGSEHNPMDVAGLYDIYFANGNQFNIHHPNLKGELKGLIDIRDGNGSYITGAAYNFPYKGIPYYMERLNTLVRTFVKAFNEGLDKNGNKIPDVTGHAQGYDLNGNTGILFFTYSQSATNLTNMGTDFYQKLNVSNFQVNPDLLGDPSMLAASSDDLRDQSNNEVINGLLKLKTYRHLFKEGQLSDYIIGMSGELGIDMEQSEKFYSSYSDVTTTIDNQRLEISGVDINEEIINLIKYQQLYQAAAKLVNIIDSIYDTTVNRLGNW